MKSFHELFLRETYVGHLRLCPPHFTLPLRKWQEKELELLGIICFFFKANPLTFLYILGCIQPALGKLQYTKALSALPIPGTPPSPQGPAAMVPGFRAEAFVSEPKSGSSIFKSFPETFHLCEYKLICVEQYIPKPYSRTKAMMQLLLSGLGPSPSLWPAPADTSPFSVCFDCSTNLTTSSLLEHFLLSAFARLLPPGLPHWLFSFFLCPLPLCVTWWYSSELSPTHLPPSFLSLSCLLFLCVVSPSGPHHFLKSGTNILIPWEPSLQLHLLPLRDRIYIPNCLFDVLHPNVSETSQMLHF